MDEDEDLPLHDEAKARAKWRGGETLIDGGSGNVGLPASEVDEAASKGVGDGEGDGRPDRGRPGDFPPPD